IRFYNRVSTTVLNAYVGPVLEEYLGNLTARLDRAGFAGVLLIMQSNGGVALPKVTAQRAANTLLSGPAAGPRAAVAYTSLHGVQDAVLVDMGGTSFDASLVQKGEAALNTEGEIDRLRIALPMLAITTIGAGGGSVGWVDEGGLLRMGPMSAGAHPGPACYGRGGTRPACTDADLLLGYLDPKFFAGGKLPLDADLAREAIQREIARPLGLGLEEAAAGMYRVINSNMAHGVREITTRRGLDPRDFHLVVAGGAGSLHGAMIALELEIPNLLVPPTASILCATGRLLADRLHDVVRSYVVSFEHLDWRRLEEQMSSMLEEGSRQLRMEGIPESAATHQVLLDLRYVKQYHEVTVPVPVELLARRDLDGIARLFHVQHDQLYGYHLAAEGTPLELINIRVRWLGRTEKPSLPKIESGGEDPGAARKGERQIFNPERGLFGPAAVFDGHRLLAGNIVPGPALIERSDTTIFVSESFTAEVDQLGSCLLRLERGRGRR
ncbi:MAG: hydantoinase/oxoprolinase family protein, partial [Planctomycetota bacterium]